jgi:hypothetical protein
MRTKTFQKIGLFLIALLCALIMCIVFLPNTTQVASAQSYYNILKYSGSQHNFSATVTCPTSITSTSSVNSFQINCYSTYIEWSIFGPNFNNVKFTMTRPDGSLKVYTFANKLISDHFSVTMFDSSSLKNDSGSVIEGTYTVSVSGKITAAGATQEQSGSFTFYVNLNSPTIALKTDGGEIADYAITNKNVTVSATDSYGTPTLKYTRSTTASYPTSASTLVSSTHTFSEEGNYIVTATDGYGRSTTKYFAIDKTAPAISISGTSNGGFTKNDVTVSWETATGGVGAPKVNSNDTLTIKYSVNTGASFPSATTTSISSGYKFTGEGNYLLTIEDKAGNRSSYTFTIDKTVPTLTLNGLITQEATKDGFSASWSTASGAGSNIANNNDALTVKYSMATSGYPSSAGTTYDKQNTFLSNEGYYLLTIEDKAGNRSTYRAIVDQTAPTVDAPAEWLNTSFVYSAEDPRGVTIEYRFNSGTSATVRDTSFDVSFDPDNYGIWEFRAKDDVGNVTEWSTVHFYYRDTFGNKVNIQNGYKTPAYWTVQLSEKDFPGIAGRYSFGSYESALSFATAKEWEYRVVDLGGKWSYVNISNESVAQIYDNREDLDRAVNKYATSNISERNVLGVSGSNYPNPTDESGVTRADALTEQNLVLPDHLSQYSGLPLYFLSHKFKYVAPVAGVSGNTRQVVFRYISNGISAQSGSDINIAYGTDIKKALDEVGAWKQGYYLVTESDLCGNIEQYIVCIDTQLPTLTAQAYYGDGSQGEVEFEQGYVSENEGVMLYIGLDLNVLADNLDEYVMLLIDGRKMDNAYFLDTDELPYLTYENGYWGIYTITVYDRSLNALTFQIKIAGEAPTLRHTSLSNETRCTFTIESSDPYNAITGVWLYKVSYTGEYVEVKEDSDGTPVSAETLKYVLRTGGKYVMRFTDIFGRTVETEPIFYMKGLPSGVLSGVKEGGITNRDVTFEYASTNGIELYIWQGGKWVLNNTLMNITSKEGYNIAEIPASAETSLLYKIFLFVAEDKNLFVEYRFEIDCIPPSVEITTSGGEPVTQGQVTNESFSVTWDENGLTAYYYNRNSSLGELGQSKYTKETLIETAGTWVFSVYDEVGNSISFTVTLDNEVSFVLEGTYSQLDDGSYIARKYLILSVTEPTSEWTVESTNGIQPTNGQRIETDGTYRFHIKDRYGNELDIVLIIDNLPPVPIIKTSDGEPVEQNSKINTSFTVTCDEDNVTIMVSSNKIGYTSYTGEILSDEGTYTFKLTDRMNNITSFTVTIDKAINYTLKGTYVTQDGKIYSRTGITVNINEQYINWVVSNVSGVTFEPGEKINIEGEYTVQIEDVAGNTLSIIIVIDHTAPTPIIQTQGGEPIEQNGSTKFPFTVTCDEPNVTMLYSDVSSSYKPYAGELVEIGGRYYFTLRDLVGNEAIFTVTIDTIVSFSIGGNYKIDSEGRYISRSWLSIEMDEDYRRFEVVSGVREFLPGERVTLEGEYRVEIEDAAGNEVIVVLVIDQTAPVAEIVTSEGLPVEPNSTINKAFILRCDEPGASVMIAGKDLKYIGYDGRERSAEGIYNFMLIDFIGNTSTFSVRIDLTVEYTLRGTYVQFEENGFVTRSNFLLDADEELAYYSICSVSSGDEYALGERLTVEDEYLAVLEDLYGNRIELRLVVDKTAPVIALGGVEPAGTTNGDVVIAIDGSASAYYRIYGQEGQTAIADSVTVSEDGYYTVFAEDLAGNEATLTFRIDKVVEVKLSQEILDGQILSGGISFTWDEQINSIVCTKDGVEISYRTGMISEPGSYTLTAVDVPGNTRSWTWTILPAVSKAYSLNIPAGWTVSVLSSGNVVSDAVIDGRIELTRTGEYVLTFEDGENSYVLTLTVDTIAPTVEITQEKNQVVIGNASKENVTYMLLRDGKEVEFSPGQAITENGEYVLTVTDELGNSSQYTFALNYINAFGIIVIVVLCVLVVLTIGVALYARTHQRIK